MTIISVFSVPLFGQALAYMKPMPLRQRWLPPLGWFRVWGDFRSSLLGHLWVTSRTLLTHLAVARSLLDGFCQVMTLLSQSFQLRGIGPIFNFIIESWQVDSYHPIPQL